MKIFMGNQAYSEFQFEKEIDFEKDIVASSRLFFGADSIYIDAKKKITAKIGNSIPDGFLFNFAEKNNPEFYLVEVELVEHDFYRHIFPQITKFFSFFTNDENRIRLANKLYSVIINSDNSELSDKFRKYLGGREIYKFLIDTLEKSQNILLIINGEKKELPEIKATYSETWGEFVKPIIIKKFLQNESVVYTMHPDFGTIEFPSIENEILEEDVSKDEEVDERYAEEDCLGNVSDNVRQIYNKIKLALLDANPELTFNSQKSYISIRKKKNIAFFYIKQKKINLLPIGQVEDSTRERISHYSIKLLEDSARKSYNGASCMITIDNANNLDEVLDFLKDLIEKSQ